MITEATRKIFADLGIKMASPDHPIYSGGSMIAFINQSGTPTKTPPSDLASPPQTTPDQTPQAYSSPVEPLVDLNNLPFDPAVRAMEAIARRHKG